MKINDRQYLEMKLKSINDRLSHLFRSQQLFIAETNREREVLKEFAKSIKNQLGDK